MENNFSYLEKRLIQGLLVKEAYVDIAALVNSSVEKIKAFAEEFVKDSGLVTYQSILDKKEARKLIASRKKKETKKVTSAVKERHSELVKKQKSPQYETKPFDPTKLVAVKVDDKTIIYVKSGEDATEARKKCLERMNRNKQDAFAPIPKEWKKNTHKGGYLEERKKKRESIS